MLLRHVLTLVDPLAIALEEDLKSGSSLTPELDGIALDDVSIHGLFEKMRQGHGLAMLQSFNPGT